MRILVFQNYPCEDAAVAGEAFERLGHSIHVIDCYGAAPPPDFSQGDAVLVLGGPMNVYEEEKHPFLRWETDWIARWVGEGRPLLGLCLGAQLLSKALGGRVTKNPQSEIGHFSVALTEAGRRDPLFAGFPDSFDVAQWHGDTFSLPPGGTLLARSALCEHQAVRVGRAVGLQFHLEIGRAKMAEWIREYVADPSDGSVDVAGILQGFEAREATYVANCHRLVANFCGAVAE